MSRENLLAGLPTEQRLALAYAPMASRDLLLGLFAFDARCAAILRGASEPLLGQLQLAWWREQLAAPIVRRPSGEPLLNLLNSWEGEEPALVALAEAWEILLDPPPLGIAKMKEFAEARGQAWAAAARLSGCEAHARSAGLAGRDWALTDLALRVSDREERIGVQDLLSSRDWSNPGLPRALRPLAVLHGLARRSQGVRPLLAGRTSLVLAVRLGMFGR